MNLKTLKTINLILVILAIGVGTWLLYEWRVSESLNQEEERTSETYYAAILEGSKRLPSIWVQSPNLIRVGEKRTFTINVKGLGWNDEVTSPPQVGVYMGDRLIATYEYPESISDSIVHGATGERLYRFIFNSPLTTGSCRLVAKAKTNRISYSTSTDSVKIGDLYFSYHNFQELISDNSELTSLYSSKDASRFDSLGTITTEYQIRVVR
jgi:hypothetical protein